jgi:hypothetical protein
MLGMMVEGMRERGTIIKCMDREYSPGKMEGGIKEVMLRIRRKALESSSGLMGKSI